MAPEAAAAPSAEGHARSVWVAPVLHCWSSCLGHRGGCRKAEPEIQNWRSTAHLQTCSQLTWLDGSKNDAHVWWL
jgi:hypothetical protein